ncbi:hypothetical protein NHP190002_12330 [Helicobacter ailurogastricus]|nr:hypothetical protein NHP190002_12330 [Helicobacter ailurogastricus]
MPDDGFVLQAAGYAKVDELYCKWLQLCREQEIKPTPIESWLFQKACQAYTFTEMTKLLKPSTGFTFSLFRYARLKDECFKEDDALLTLEEVEKKHQKLEAQYEALAGTEAGWMAIVPLN